MEATYVPKYLLSTLLIVHVLLTSRRSVKLFELFLVRGYVLTYVGTYSPSTYKDLSTTRSSLLMDWTDILSFAHNDPDN